MDDRADDIMTKNTFGERMPIFECKCEDLTYGECYWGHPPCDCKGCNGHMMCGRCEGIVE